MGAEVGGDDHCGGNLELNAPRSCHDPPPIISSPEGMIEYESAKDTLEVGSEGLVSRPGIEAGAKDTFQGTPGSLLRPGNGEEGSPDLLLMVSSPAKPEDAFPSSPGSKDSFEASPGSPLRPGNEMGAEAAFQGSPDLLRMVSSPAKPEDAFLDSPGSSASKDTFQASFSTPLVLSSSDGVLESDQDELVVSGSAKSEDEFQGSPNSSGSKDISFSSPLVLSSPRESDQDELVVSSPELTAAAVDRVVSEELDSDRPLVVSSSSSSSPGVRGTRQDLPSPQEELDSDRPLMVSSSSSSSPGVRETRQYLPSPQEELDSDRPLVVSSSSSSSSGVREAGQDLRPSQEIFGTETQEVALCSSPEIVHTRSTRVVMMEEEKEEEGLVKSSLKAGSDDDDDDDFDGLFEDMVEMNEPSSHSIGTPAACRSTRGSRMSSSQPPSRAATSTASAFVTPAQAGFRGGAVLVSDDNITPTPNYRTMKTPKLKSECARFGVKVLPKRKMIAKLTEIYAYTHPLVGKEYSFNFGLCMYLISQLDADGEVVEELEDVSSGVKIVCAWWLNYESCFVEE